MDASLAIFILQCWINFNPVFLSTFRVEEDTHISTPQTVSYKKWQSFILLNLNPLSQKDSHTLLFVRGVISQDKVPLTILQEEDSVLLLNSPNHSPGRANHSFCDGMDIRQLTCSPSFPAPLPKFVGSAFCLYLSRDNWRTIEGFGTRRTYLQTNVGNFLWKAKKLMSFAYASL